MSRVNIFELCKKVSMEAEDFSGDTISAREADNHETDIKVLMDEAVEQAEEHDEEDGIEVENDNDGQLATSMEELELGTIEEDVVEQVQDIEEGYQDIEEVNGATMALEAYHDMLSGMYERGYEVSRETATAINIGLEMIDPQAFKGVVISVEDIRPGTHSAKGTMGNISARLKQLWELIKRTIAKVMDSVRNLWNFLVNNLDKLEKVADGLIKDLKTKQRSIGSGNVEVKLKSVSGLLSVDGKEFLQPQDYKSLREAVDLVGTKVPTAVHSTVMDMKRDISDYVDAKNKGDAGRINTDIVRLLDSNFKSIFAKNPEAGEYVSDAVLGNVHVALKAKGTSNLDGIMSTYGLGNTLFSMSMVNEGKSQVKDFDGYVNIADCVGVAESVKDLINDLRDMRDMRKTAKEVQKEFKGDVPVSDKLTAQWVVDKMAANVMKDAIRLNVQFTGHVVSVIKSTLSFLKAVDNKASVKDQVKIGHDGIKKLTHQS